MLNEGHIMFEYEREQMAKMVETMMERDDTNIAGGNFSFLHTDISGDYGPAGKRYMIMTPTLMSEEYDGHITPPQVLVVDPETTKIVAGDGMYTREINMHEGIYKANHDIKAIMHAHAKEQMVWATMGIPIPNLTEITQLLKGIKVMPFRQMCTQELADAVSKHIASIGDDALMHEVLLNSHGIVITVGGKNMSGVTALHKAAMFNDTMEWDAHIALEQTHLIKEGLLDGYYSEGAKIGSLDDVFKDKKSVYNPYTIKQLESMAH